MGRGARPQPADRRHELAAVLGRQHFSSRAAGADDVGAPVRPGVADPPGLLDHRQHHPLLQPVVPLDVRAVGVGHLPAGPRSDRRSPGRLHCGAGLRLPPVPHRVGAPHPGDELAVDAVRAVRAESVCLRCIRCIGCSRCLPVARRWNGGAGHAELVLRLLPALLRAVRATVRRPSHVGDWPAYARAYGPCELRRGLAEAASGREGGHRTHLGLSGGSGRRHPHSDAPLPAAVYEGAAAVRLRAPVRRSGAVLGQPLVVCDRVRKPVVVRQGAALLPAR